MILNALWSKALCGGRTILHPRCDGEIASVEGICYVGFAGYSIQNLVKSASVVPSPIGSDQVIEGLVFAGSFQDGMCGSLVVTKLDIWGSEGRLK